MADTDTSSANAALTLGQRRRLLRLAYRFCWNRSDAEDALQNAMVVALRKAEQLRDPERIWPWLCRIVVQQCRLLHRRRRPAVLQEPIEAAHANESVSQRLSQQELGELMKRLLVQLPHKQRVALTLRHIEHLEYPAIAAVMNVTESTVRAHVRAGRETLRGLILSHHPEWRP